MKVVFIDIDGVFNHTQALTKTKFKLQVGGYGVMGIYLPTLKNLKRIVEETDAKVVLVSSWKDSYVEYMREFGFYKDHKLCLCIEGYYLREKFRKAGIEIYDTTKYCEPSMWRRGEGILNWIKKYENIEKIDNYIIIDDELFDYVALGIDSKVVKTSFYKGGLNDKLTDLAISMLKS